MEILKNFLQKYPEIAVFLTLALGFLVGKRKFFQGLSGRLFSSLMTSSAQ